MTCVGMDRYGCVIRACLRGGRIALALIWTLAAAAGAAVSDDELFVAQGGGRSVTISAPIGSVGIGDSHIADAKLSESGAVYVFGIAKGKTDLTIFSEQGKAIASMRIVVAPNKAKAAQQKRHPDSGLVYDVVGARLVLHRGKAPLPDAAAQRAPEPRPLDRHGDDPVDAASRQITLKVRFAEVSRNEVRNLGFDWNAVFSPGISDVGGVPGGRFDARLMLEALESKGVVHTIAEPNLTVKNGHTAKFRAGGDIPVPVPQAGAAGAIAIEYHSYGVSLEFTPVLIGRNRIAIHVVPEVSEISQDNAVNLGGASVPSFTVRRSETDVDLAGGQTFAMAGLFQRKPTEAESGLPGVKDIPVIGTLFKSRDYQRGESELVILITPYVVEPISEATEKGGGKPVSLPPPLVTERIGFIVD